MMMMILLQGDVVMLHVCGSLYLCVGGEGARALSVGLRPLLQRDDMLAPTRRATPQEVRKGI